MVGTRPRVNDPFRLVCPSHPLRKSDLGVDSSWGGEGGYISFMTNLY